ncbi:MULTISPECIES: TlpA family protein disulfide reductase [Niastella]|uniref:TlpA family protein disulfide reductase n=1 Tax=Niastella soli TaxID=2821487 RepID=A0ABS3YXE7_9BACT|nr:TlpA disulfide reductase family protein [Niastella soli]MBO9202583.1 TlpA family protein disulfide reductase [Niastella soli]
MLFRSFLLIFLMVVAIAGVRAQGQERKPADSMLTVQAPLFKMKDMNGKVASLSDYKGKVVVLMFWSTWCQPCHLDFPSVNNVIKDYAGDTSVVFLFIDTREKASNYRELVQEDLRSHHYDFNVLFDEMGPDGMQSKYYTAYGMIGIPTKFIIDRNGIIRYQLIGYNSKMKNEEAAITLQQLIRKVKAV